MKINSRALVLTMGCLSFQNRPIHGVGKYLQVEYPPSTTANQMQIGVTYTMWIPDDVARFRCAFRPHLAPRSSRRAGGISPAVESRKSVPLVGPSGGRARKYPFQEAYLPFEWK
jgi:hypothetical protein